MTRDIYQEVTDKIIGQIETGALPWLQPWQSATPHSGMPYNIATGAAYSGVNILMLWANGVGRATGGWLTYKQAQALGAHVRRGEKGTQIVVYKPLLRTETGADGEAAEKVIPLLRTETGADGEAAEKVIPMLRTYTVFNREQIDGLPALATLPSVAHQPHAADQLAAQHAAQIIVGGDVACFVPSKDLIRMPPRAAFIDDDNYAATLLHELTHWSGHAARLGRVFPKRYGDQAYAMEELVAELGAAFLCARLGVRGELRHASYIEDWLRVMKADKRAIFTAASAANKAADYLAGKTAQPAGELPQAA